MNVLEAVPLHIKHCSQTLAELIGENLENGS